MLTCRAESLRCQRDSASGTGDGLVKLHYSPVSSQKVTYTLLSFPKNALEFPERLRSAGRAGTPRHPLSGEMFELVPPDGYRQPARLCVR